MRPDLQKVIVERPRRGSRAPNRNSALRLRGGLLTSVVAEGDDYDSGARRPFRPREKHLNENLQPLKRYLLKQVGRPWTKVYSEIRAAIDTRSAIGLHVLQHVPHMVSTETLAVGQVIYARWRWGHFWPVEGLYVHPTTGLLRNAKPRPSRPTTPAQGNFVRVSDHLVFDKRSGLWFRHEYDIDAEGLRVLTSRLQCDRKTIRQIENGDWGEVVYQPS